MKLGKVKTMVLPAAGIGLGMFAAPKVTAASPTLSKYPWLVPLILIFVALILMRYRATRGLALGFGAIAFVFLAQAVMGMVTGKGATAAQTTTGDLTGGAPGGEFYPDLGIYGY